MNLFWWRKRNEGFEWREYVRTTILVRREQRRQKIKDVQHAAAEHLKDAGQRGLDASLSGVRSAGTGLRAVAGKSGAMLVTAAQAAVPAIGIAVLAAGRAVATGARVISSGLAAAGHCAGGRLTPRLGRLLSFARKPGMALALKIVAGVAGLGAAYRAWTFGADGDVWVAAALSLIAATVAGLAFATDEDRPRREERPQRRREPDARESLIERLRAGDVSFPASARLDPRTVGFATLAVLAVAVIGAGAVHLVGTASERDRGAGRITTGALPPSEAPSLTGRATALTGDTLRLSGKKVALDGIEAPDIGQVCDREGDRPSKWRCGSEAKEALAALVRGRRVTCEIVATAESGLSTARCATGESDLAAKLVSAGKVFATGGFMGAYAGLESDAADRKLGLWAGEPERPADWRARRWDEARRTAPDGCPIKGRVRSGARTYVLPSSPSYDSIELKPARGERWFCSEDEARDAGWSSAAPL